MEVLYVDANELFEKLSSRVSEFGMLKKKYLYFFPETHRLSQHDILDVFDQMQQLFTTLAKGYFSYDLAMGIASANTTDDVVEEVLVLFNRAHRLTDRADWGSERPQDRDILMTIFSRAYIPAFFAALSGKTFRHLYPRYLYYTLVPEHSPD